MGKGRKANIRGGLISKAKARKILGDKQIKGKPITPKQRRFFGAKAK